ncbi:MAG: glycosyltransferase family 2 protein [Candidatus Sumerlaeia bacterium]
MEVEPSDQNTTLSSRVAALVPCYNAGGRVVPVLKRLLEKTDRVIVVDDGSTDNLRGLIEGLPVRTVAFPVNRGKGHALLAGFREALADGRVECVVTLDSDGQHDPDELPRLYDSFRREQADLVIGSRVFESREIPWRSRFGNNLTISLTGLLLGQRLPDTQSGYRLHSRRFIEHILETIRGGRYETEMEILAHALKGRFKAVPVPIKTIYVEGNASSHFHVLRDSFLIYRKLLAMTFLRGGRW